MNASVAPIYLKRFFFSIVFKGAIYFLPQHYEIFVPHLTIHGGSKEMGLMPSSFWEKNHFYGSLTCIATEAQTAKSLKSFIIFMVLIHKQMKF